ncbi:uncharacterized protein LOC135334840 [Halichondria panicea]|uniref:uncharacterized protein LOC135334840 n=1 Tax=Halichondria panicea TaxID=6063 RepID=UPI00312B960E
MTDSETASYVLAYLLKHNYSQTASTFLQECQVLPSKSLLILPETPLHSLIAEHKLRSDATVLMSTMGPSSSWRALWDKLHITLEQLKVVYEEGPTLKAHNHGTTSLSQRPRVTQLRKPTHHPLPTQPPTPPTQPSRASPPSQVTQEMAHTITLSPHRRKPVPKRKELTDSPLRGPPLSPSTQHMFDSLMGDSELPGKLADIINRCVSRDESTSERSPLTLSTIIDRTYSDPALEGLLHTSLDGPSHVIPPDDHVIPPDDHVIPLDDDHSTHSDDSALQSPPPAKKPRADTMTEQDIEAFLDQLHS